MYNSDNDFIVPAIRGQELTEHLGGTFHLIHGAGHFTPWTGYRNFPQVLESVVRIAA